MRAYFTVGEAFFTSVYKGRYTLLHQTYDTDEGEMEPARWTITDASDLQFRQQGYVVILSMYV